MKKYITDSMETKIPEINIEIYTDHPILHLDLETIVSGTVVGSKYGLSDRPVIAKDKNRVEGWMIADFEAFVERVEDLCEDNYNLILTYTNVSSDYSHYYNYLAKDKDGNIIAKFRIRLRVSNHDPHSTKQQKKNKKQELKSEKLHQLLTDKQILKLRSYPMLIVVNGDEYDSYDDAFEDVEKLLERAYEVVTR